eukprot:CAMPEP_0202696154 /NCGR_PEP_ID=MMETSP1385-20130828/9487_1 /ASSEMBLY_ACC=CAM_ASM_000861 /TAXON_ID=933848 /ORGANISM="Elphidium margaritaceum" /LENGTH=464 /DNA_ID=CAMNT_0049352267 /DNA_START=59 /DNA_END=1453 /DNA_ORIENTATION=+
MACSETKGGYDAESALPYAYGPYGTFEQMSQSGGENAWNTSKASTNYPPAIAAPNGIYPNQQIIANNSALLSPSYSRRSKSGMTHTLAGGSRNKRGSLASQLSLPEHLDGGHGGGIAQPNAPFLPIQKRVIVYLTFICCVLMANMIQMIVLYSVLSDEDSKKYILIYAVFPFLTFILLKINDLVLCNTVAHLYEFGYTSIPCILNRKRELIHALTFIGFPVLWLLYFVFDSAWIQSMPWTQRIDMRSNKGIDAVMNDVLVTTWTAIEFGELILCIVCLLYCVQHNIHQQEPKQPPCQLPKSTPHLNHSFSMSVSNTFHSKYAASNINAYIERIQILERQLHSLQNDLVRSKQENIAAASQISTEYHDELDQRNQEYRALLTERDLLKQDCDHKKSLLGLKKQQIKQQLLTIKNLQGIREENIKCIAELKKKLCGSNKEAQKLQLMLQIERQNAQKAQEYYESFA